MKQILYFLILWFTTLIYACSDFHIPHADEPKHRVFEYNDFHFKYDSTETNLRLDGMYYKMDQLDSVENHISTYQFYDDGLVISRSLVNAELDYFLHQEKETRGKFFGYYKYEKNQLFFTTKSYYSKTRKYECDIYPDSIVCNYQHYKTKAPMKDTYQFYNGYH